MIQQGNKSGSAVRVEIRQKKMAGREKEGKVVAMVLLCGIQGVAFASLVWYCLFFFVWMGLSNKTSDFLRHLTNFDNKSWLVMF